MRGNHNTRTTSSRPAARYDPSQAGVKEVGRCDLLGNAREGRKTKLFASLLVHLAVALRKLRPRHSLFSIRSLALLFETLGQTRLGF